jgi:hypothetical protein
MDAGDPHLLIVTGPLRDRLYERFVRLYANASDVRVIKDRRYGERRRSEQAREDDRRRSEQAREDDRRRADRRRRPPEWVFPPESV